LLKSFGARLTPLGENLINNFYKNILNNILAENFGVIILGGVFYL
jgi:hypothetical protein